jgi:hypothetical protein
MVMVI